MRPHVAILSAFVLLLAGCSSEDNGSEQKMANADDSEITYPHERPGAVLIWPDRNPDMVYDSETRRITDTKTGEYLGVGKGSYGDAGVRGAFLRNSDGTMLYEYTLKYGGKIEGATVLTIWQVFGARRGDWLERFQGKEVAGQSRTQLAQKEAQDDSLERLAEFLRAHSRGIGEHFGLPGQKNIDDTVVVDRRKDDPIEIRKESLF
jgi:hypothetical protein